MFSRVVLGCVVDYQQADAESCQSDVVEFVVHLVDFLGDALLAKLLDD